MIVYLNGRFLPEERASISIHDRGFLYGDGLFETVRLYDGEPFLWREHMERFTSGAAALGIVPPLSAGEMLRVLRELSARNGERNAMARITLTRGAGRRGYSPRGASDPTFLMAVFTLPPSLPKTFQVITSQYHVLSTDRLSRRKHANKLTQVLARAEADRAEADEAILLNELGNVAEATSANLFWVRNGVICTSRLEDGALPGVTRGYVLGLAREDGFAIREESSTPGRLKKAEGLFLTSSGIEIMEVSHWDGCRVRRSPLVRKLKSLYRRGRDLLK